MLELSSYIEIETAGGLIKMPHVHDVHIERDWKQMTATAVLKFGKRIVGKDADMSKTPLSKVVKGGDKVLVRLGYTSTSLSDQLPIEFTGYVVRVNPKVPMEIECEDEMYVLKRRRVSPKVITG